jgi:hypothetical protein
MPYQPYNPTWVNPYLQGQQGVPQYQPLAAPTNGITKVNGIESARQYTLPPNSMSPALFDNNGKTFYVVSTDGAGGKTVEAFDYVPHVEREPITVDGAQFVSREEFDGFVSRVDAALGALDELHATVPESDAGDAKPIGNSKKRGSRKS